MRELALIQTAKTPPSLHELDPTIPRHLARTVARAITKRPEQRFASMSELGAALRDSLARHTADVQTDRHSVRTGGAPSGAETAPDADRQSVRPLLIITEPLSGERFRASGTSVTSLSANTLPPVTRAPKAQVERGSRRGWRHRSLRRVLVAGAAVGTFAGGVTAAFLTSSQPSARNVNSAPAATAPTAIAARALPVAHSSPAREPVPPSVSAAAAPMAAQSAAATSAPPAVPASERDPQEAAAPKAKPPVKASRKEPPDTALSEPLAPPARKIWSE